MLKRIRGKNLNNWLLGYGRSIARRAAIRRPKHRHLLFCLCDHYEPLWGKGPNDEENFTRGLARVQAWEQQYPELAGEFVDADGMPPRHSFFFPGEEYDPKFLAPLADLARREFGEVELHLHHDNDTDENLRVDIANYLDKFASHGHISRDAMGRYQYAFIHGNWCLANARSDGRWCGVDNEMQLLFDTGCYADYTFPSPEESQPALVNQIYWPTGIQSRRRAYDTGEGARVGVQMHDRLLMITGPLALAKRPGRPALRIESSTLDASDPPSPERLKTWVNQGIHVAGQPEWVFVKVHTHGAPEDNAKALLGDAMRDTHRAMTEQYNDGEHWSLHYVTAREMYNIALAAMDGQTGNPGQFRDFKVARPPVAK